MTNDSSSDADSIVRVVRSQLTEGFGVLLRSCTAEPTELPAGVAYEHESPRRELLAAERYDSVEAAISTPVPESVPNVRSEESRSVPLAPEVKVLPLVRVDVRVMPS